MRIAALLLLAFAAPAAAGDAPLAGGYTHAFVEPAGEVVWRIVPAGDGLRVLRTGDGAEAAAIELDARAREALWAHYGWPAATSREARCAGWRDDDADELVAGVTSVLCRVPRRARADIAWIADYAEDTFYADVMLGVMEVRRVD